MFLIYRAIYNLSMVSDSAQKLDAKKALVQLERFKRIQLLREKSFEVMLKTLKKVNDYKYKILKNHLEKLNNGT